MQGLPGDAVERSVRRVRILEYPQVELPDDGQHVVEDIGLDLFVPHPFLLGGETVDLQRESGGAGLQLAHHVGHLGIDVGAVCEPKVEVFAEGPDVGQAELVQGVFVLGVVGLQFGLFVADVVFQQVGLGQGVDFLRGQVMDGGNVDIDGAFYPGQLTNESETSL